MLAMFPGADGSAPAIPHSDLVAAARKALAEQNPKADEEISFFEYGSRTKTGAFATSSFTVDGAKRIFWSSPSERRLILQFS